jgi:photosystem II stability/assembly factor-like uncharacterized protein
MRLITRRKSILALSLATIAISSHAQPFLENPSGKQRSFRELVLTYESYRKSHELKPSDYWKHFKRYEQDMQLHTNGHGEPAGFAEYVEAAIAAAEERKNSQSAASWYPAGPNAVPFNETHYMENGIGRVNCVAFHPTNTSIFYVGVAQGGVWKTINGGNSYTPLTDNLPITRVSDICIDPNASNTMYISLCDFEYVGKGLYLDGRKRHTHYGLGVYKTTDGGTTWNPTGLTFQLTNGDASLIRKILVRPSNSAEVLACGVSGMYRSTNSGATWTKVLDSLFWDMVSDPSNPNVIYASTGWVENSGLGHAAVYKSTNFGVSWTMLNTGIPLQGTVQGVRLAVAPTDGNYVYAMTCDYTEGFHGIYASTNAGTSWTYKPALLNVMEWADGSSSGGQGTYDMAIAVDGSDKNKIYTGGINVWVSGDGGTNFQPATYWKTDFGPTIHCDIHAIARQPSTSNIFVCSDGGVYKTSNLQGTTWGNTWPTTWVDLSDGMQVTSFYRISSSKNSAGRLTAGAQDNATSYLEGSSVKTVFGGDGMDNFTDPIDNDKIIGSSQYGNFYLSDDDGYSGNYVSTNPNNEDAEWVTPIVADYAHPGVMYVGNENIVKSVNGGYNWTPLANIYSNNSTQERTEISAMAVSPTNSNVIYAARRVRHEVGKKAIVFRTTNGGTAFTNITANLPDTLYYTGIECSPSNSNEAVVCMAGFAAGHKVYKTMNGGTAWTNISYNLPNIPVNCVKYFPGSQILIVATDLGVYMLKPGATTWTGYSAGLPNVIVSDIEFNPALDKMYVSTFGRGIWATSLSQATVSLNENKMAARDLQVFPSPSTGRFTIGRNGAEPLDIAIYDVTGRLVYENTLKDDHLEVYLKEKPGVYYIVATGISYGVKKILIE